MFLEGHLNECLGDLLLQAGRSSEGVYFAEALRLYNKCRAERKEISLIENHSEYFDEEKISYLYPVVESPSIILPDLDIKYLMKSSLAISAEIELEALLKKIMNVVIESSGAQHGYLLMEEEGNLLIRAESHATEKEVVKTSNKKLEDTKDICEAIVRYVHRTGERLILNNAAQEGIFKDNPKIHDMQLRSVLCLPVIKQSKMIGVIYLENRLSDSVFTSEKTDMMELLVSQAAISLENATLFSERKKAEEKIRSLANIVESSNDAIITISLDGIITSWNKGAKQVYGYSAEEILGKPISILFPSHSDEGIKKLTKIITEGEDIEQYETSRLRKNGTIIYVSITLSPVLDIHGKLTTISVIARDITKRKETEDVLANIETARKKEIHHRIKNNLQVISSLLDLQADKFNDPKVIEAFRESQDRVISMALIHEEIYKGGGYDTLNFSPYIEELTKNLFLTYRIGNINVSLKMDLEENLIFDMDTAIPLGIIVNELVSNSLKHAFKGRDKGEIRIKLHKEENGESINGIIETKSKDCKSTSYTLNISDNGVGIPENLDIENLNSLGLQLVTSLVDQLGGELELKRNNRTEFTMQFMITEK